MDSPQQFLELHNSSQSKNRQIAGRGITLEEIYSMLRIASASSLVTLRISLENMKTLRVLGT